MSKKYVIDLPDDAQYILINGASENHCYTRVEQVDDLEELNSDYINEHFGELQDTAYKKGLHDGESKCRYCNDYQRGLEDAWEATKRIFGYEIDGGFPINKVCEAFGIAENAIFCTADIIRDYTVQEVVDKIKTYEDKHSDRIEVGDEVKAPRGKAIVTAVKDDLVHYFYSNGDIGCVEPYYVTKTGKHYDIQSILEAMRK